MHPILFSIPLNWATVIVVAVIFGAGAVIRARFKPADRDASYLATFLGLNVQWGVVDKPWGRSFAEAIIPAGIAGGIAFGLKTFSKNWNMIEVRDGVPYLPLHIYGLMMATAFMVGIWLATREAAHEQLPNAGTIVIEGKKYPLRAPDLVSDLAFYLLIAGLAGSRILYIITRWDEEYRDAPLKIFRVWEGGLVWYGGLIAATVVSAWFIRKHKVAFLPYADVLVPGVSLAHGIGRLGCFAAGCCFGHEAPKGFPLGLQFPPGSPAAAEHFPSLMADAGRWSNPVYPTQIMEALGETILFLILLRVRSRKRFHGQVILTYFFLYAFLRAVMEMFRGDTIRGFVFKWPEGAKDPLFLSTSQAVSIITFVGGVIATIILVRGRAKADARAAAASSAQAA